MVQIRLDHSSAISLCFYLSIMSFLGQSTFTTLAVLALPLISLILFNSLNFRDVGRRGSPSCSATRSATRSTLCRALCRRFRSFIGLPTSGSSRAEFRYPAIMASDHSDSTIKQAHRRLHCTEIDDGLRPAKIEYFPTIGCHGVALPTHLIQQRQAAVARDRHCHSLPRTFQLYYPRISPIRKTPLINRHPSNNRFFVS
jgi:hypothetical protein